jgi:two-component system, LytTR family, response regulator
VKIRTLIVDDEPLARERIRKLLQKEADIEIVGEYGDGREAVSAVNRDKPDLVFLDVQMPELDGFGVLDQLERQALPAIVFVTAYDKFALRAFEVHALDYLLKPFDRERFEKMLERVRTQIKGCQTAELGDRISELLADLKTGPKHHDRLAIKSGGKVVFLKFDEVDWIEAADNYVNLHVGNESHLHRQTMAALEGKLPADKFMRISRSTIVNTERIKELQPLFHGEYAVILRNGTRLTLSRSHRQKLDQLLGRTR